MNKTLKYTTALGSATVAMAFAFTVASADTGIVNSGNNANVDTSTTQNTTVTVSNSNSAQISQSSFNVANTGGNSTSGNIGGGSVASGAAVTSTNLGATANQNQTAIALPSSGLGSGDANVVNTGNHLDLDNSSTQNTTAVVSNNNQLYAQQHSVGLANSGLNSTDGNIGGGNVTTGPAATATEFDIEANANQTALDLSGMGNGMGGALSFTNTGNHANVDNSNVLNTTVVVSNDNTACISQDAFSLANSGLNFTDGNIGGGSVATGGAMTGTEFSVMANKNMTGIDMASLGGLSGADTTAVNTGNNMNLNSGTTVNTTATASSTNAVASAQTSVDVSNSGLNFGFGNIWGGSTTSGNAGTMNGLMFGANWNQTLFN